MMWKKYFAAPITIEEVNEAEMYAEAHGVPLIEKVLVKNY